jgi:hypothetical protein
MRDHQVKYFSVLLTRRRTPTKIRPDKRIIREQSWKQNARQLNISLEQWRKDIENIKKSNAQHHFAPGIETNGQ